MKNCAYKIAEVEQLQKQIENCVPRSHFTNNEKSDEKYLGKINSKHGLNKLITTRKFVID